MPRAIASLMFLAIVLVLVSASPAFAIVGCQACDCACPTPPCFCWCRVQTGQCECSICGSALTAETPGTELTFVGLLNEGVSACMALGQSIDSLSLQVDGSPVYFGDSGVIKFLTQDALQTSHFSKNIRLSANLNLSFDDLEAEVALMLVAKAARLDLAVPRGLTARVSGRFRSVTWREALSKILELADTDLRPERTANGLVVLR